MSMRSLFQFRWNSIHAKLLITYLLLAIFGTSLMAGYLLWSFYDYFIKVQQTDLENWANALSESVADALQDKDYEQVSVLVQRYGAPETVALRVFDATGHPIATSTPLLDQRVVNWQGVKGIREALDGRSVSGITQGVLSTDDRLFTAKPIIRDGQLLGVLRMSITLSQFQRQFANLLWTILGALALTILLCALLSDRFARSLSKPIEIMRNFAMRVGGGHFEGRLMIQQSTELDQLAAELNRMSARLASLDQERRTFLANVSHELRTPISNVQVTVEALRNGAVEEPDLRDRLFQLMDDETQRLSRLIRDLLDLGRLEAGVSQIERQPISLRWLINRAVSAMEVRMQSLGIVAQVEAIDVTIQADSERLLQALLNLLDNAVKHSKSNSRVMIKARRSGKDAVIKIQDQGPGISEQDLPHIFEQFYTTDPSRQGSGSGLELAIAKRIVEAHNGSIAATSISGQGAVFTIRLPL